MINLKKYLEAVKDIDDSEDEEDDSNEEETNEIEEDNKVDFFDFESDLLNKLEDKYYKLFDKELKKWLISKGVNDIKKWIDENSEDIYIKLQDNNGYIEDMTFSELAFIKRN